MLIQRHSIVAANLIVYNIACPGRTCLDSAVLDVTCKQAHAILVPAAALQLVKTVQAVTYHNVCEARGKVCVPESTAFSGNTHQLQLLLRVTATQVQPHATQKQAILVITPVCK